MAKRIGVIGAAITLGLVIAIFAGSGEDTKIRSSSPQVAFSPTAVPEMINYQGVLTDGAGDPLTATVSITFTIYDAMSGGNALWTETHASVPVNGGLFNVVLGSVNPLTSSVFDGSDRWLGLTVGGDPEMSPRQQLTSVPYAYMSGGGGAAGDNHSLDAADGNPVDAVYVDNEGDVGIGTTTPEYELDVEGDIHASGGIGAGNSIWIGLPVPDAITSTSGEMYLGRFPGNFEDIKVGIGTRNPGASLDVSRTNHGGLGVVGLFSNPSDAAGSEVALDLGIGTAAPTAWRLRGTGSSLHIENAVAFPPAITVLGNGNIGFGTTSPQVSLHINSTYFDPVRINSSSTAAGIRFSRNNDPMGMCGYGDLCGGGNANALTL